MKFGVWVQTNEEHCILRFNVVTKFVINVSNGRFSHSADSIFEPKIRFPRHFRPLLNSRSRFHCFINGKMKWKSTGGLVTPIKTLIRSLQTNKRPLNGSPSSNLTRNERAVDLTTRICHHSTAEVSGNRMNTNTTRFGEHLAEFWRFNCSVLCLHGVWREVRCHWPGRVTWPQSARSYWSVQISPLKIREKWSDRIGKSTSDLDD